ncbi:MATE family efflux transporter [Rhodobacterales bacterium]|nr:MATE family efflux transporter [Rhodobacterales bacterium]
MDTSRANVFTQGPLAATLARTALPIIFVMSMNGLLAVTDAVFLGYFAGADALSAVTLMFPAYMLLASLATLISSGMSSVLARKLGAGQIEDARSSFAGAHGLCLLVAALAMLLFLVAGSGLTRLAADGDEGIAGMAHKYLAITLLFSPLFFLLTVHGDALRNEGRAGLMAAISLVVSTANIGFDYVVIACLGFGVAGAALGTGAAQVLAMTGVVVFRTRGDTPLRLQTLSAKQLTCDWARILALGAPQSLGFLGTAIGSAATVTALQIYAPADYETNVAAYGVVTRILTFAYLPLLGFCQALQSMIGNNLGAGLLHRSDGVLRIGLAAAIGYCLTLQILLTVYARQAGGIFSDAPALAEEIAHILPMIVGLYFASGPHLVIASYFQARGKAAVAGLLSLLKPYVFFVPLVFVLPAAVGANGIWLASPIAEGCLAVACLTLLALLARRDKARLGLFLKKMEEPGE